MGKFSDYKVQLKSLAPGVSTQEFHLGKKFFQDMENADIHDADLDVKLTIDYKGDIYNLFFEVKGTITLLCDRCLDDLVLPVDTTYNIAVEYGDDYNDESDNLLVIPHSDNFLNVAYMLHDTVALTIPIKHVHPAGKCNRAMSNILKKHRASRADEAEEAEEEMMENLIDEMDTMESPADSATSSSSDEATDPRWDALRSLKDSGTTED